MTSPASAAVVQTITPPSPDALVAPREVDATTHFEVTYPQIADESGPNDRVNLVPAGTPEDYFDELDAAWDSHMTIEGNPLRFWSPIEPGEYELRHWDVTAETLLTRRPIRVLPGVAASLDAPEEVAVGSVFRVGWSGPGHENDAIFLMEPGADPDITLLPVASAVVPTDGGPVELTAPSEPGVYELRYVYGGGVGSSLGGGAMVSLPIRVVARSGIGQEGDFR